ncbi:MAG: lipopolysaccharide biosynthesis protein [Pseudomonadota bacterium]
MSADAAPFRDVDPSDLKRASTRGVAINLTGQGAKFVAQLTAQIVLARILAPADFGLIAMAMPLVNFAVLFRDIGLSQATIQKPELTDAESTAMFWINVAFSFGLVALTVIVSPLAALLYHDARVTQVLMALAFLLAFAGLSAQHAALMNRHFRFGALAFIDVAATFIGAGVAIASALMGAGYWSLVILQLVTSATTTALTWVMSHWRPSAPTTKVDVRGLLLFGSHVTGSNIVNYFARNLDNILIGAAFGTSALGLYDRAYKLMTLPLTQLTQPLGRVATPLLSRSQHDDAQYRRAFAGVLELALLCTFPIGLAGATGGHRIIVFFLGERWSEAATIFQWLAFGVFMAPLGHGTGWLFMTQARTRAMLFWGVVGSLVFVVAIIVGLHWGPVGVAAAYVLSGYLIQGPMNWWAATRQGPVRLKHFLRIIYPFFLAGALTLAVLYALEPRLPGGFFGLVLFGLADGIVFLAFLALIPRGRAMLLTLLSRAPLILPRRFSRPRG